MVAGPPLIVALVGFGALGTLRHAVARDVQALHALQAEVRLSDVIARLADVEAAETAYWWTGAEDALAPSRLAGPAIARDLAALRALQPADSSVAADLDSLVRTSEAVLATADTVVSLRRSAGQPAPAGLAAALRGDTLTARARSLATALSAREAERSRTLAATAVRERRLGWLALAVGTAIATLFGLVAHSRLTDQARVSEARRRDAERARADAEHARATAEQARRRAEAASIAKSQFLTTMSHELRTPLNAVTGYADLLSAGIRGPLTAAQSDDVVRIRKAARHLLVLINDVLNLSDLEAGRVAIAVDSFAVDGMLAEAAAMIAPQASAKGLTLVHSPGGPAVTATADREKSVQIVLNLLSNAVKFTPSGGSVVIECRADTSSSESSLESSLESSARDGRARIVVADTGRGIPPDQLARVFEPFVQLDRQLASTDQGLGLGLAISRDLARAMGGDLTAESSPGVGSRFTVTLPGGASSPLASGPRGPRGDAPDHQKQPDAEQGVNPPRRRIDEGADRPHDDHREAGE